MGFLRVRPLFALWLVLAGALIAVAPWNWLPLVICGPWVAAVLWATLRNPDDESSVPPSSADAARRRLEVR
ncbi:MAG TPA: hypothetical protein VLN26_11285 [Gaiellaceae bacterium]|nr:hypothetical protein [Gaiellaceae bacterium]